MNNFLRSLESWIYKNTHFEFFSTEKMYLPVSTLAVYYAVMLKSFNWISYVNPRIYKSGLFEHSKYNLLKKMPQEVTLKSVFVKKNTSYETVLEKIHQGKLTFPLIIKPDRLYRGIGIIKIRNAKELMKKYPQDYDILVQEYASYGKEYAVFYVRFPEEKYGVVTSLIEKEFMQFIGDGISSLAELISSHPRGWLYTKKLAEIYSQEQLCSIPQDKERISSGFIGSHHKGTIFHNRLSKSTEKMSKRFDTLTKNIPEFYYGRYDVMTDSIKDLEDGNFEILELNAAVGEPVHMYDPKTTILEGYRILFTYWSMMAKIAQQNKKRGIMPAKKT